MSRVKYSNINYGDAADAASLNSRFDAFETATATGAIDDGNFQVQTFDTLTLDKSSIYPDNGSEIISDTAAVGTYTGTTFTTISHGSNTLEFTNISLQSGDTLIISWKQTILDQTPTAPDVTSRVSFRLYWNIGAGEVQVPNSQTWDYSTYNNITGVVTSQKTYINGSGTFAYKASGTVSISTLRLKVRSDVVSGGSVDLGVAGFYFRIIRR